ncbi:PilT protein domain protein [Desulfamplus magnetovallimortis]|uniref:PilT protein domain protein n=1 Tax=Desulfamplus magnetovallimortis TaxID=1246637 RepID=A0A1W1H7Q2_9BACT|nr:type II toxin-antitoxin system VapC family toxin [Desulfamplus magnetovallimortis]SLM28464.1 PilT protein domain protein [Desulfamplus magnetovallimortis]
MKAIDTNILIRFLTGDDELQAKKVYSIFKKAESDKEELFVPLLVMLEVIWVLESVYEVQRHDILDAVSDILLMPILKFEQHSVLQEWSFSAQKNNCDLSDLLIAHSAKYVGCDSVLTFDKKASKYELFELI